MSDSYASKGQLQELSALLVQKLPGYIFSNIAQQWIENPDSVGGLLQKLHDGPTALVKEKREYVVTIDPTLTPEDWGKRLEGINRATIHFDSETFGPLIRTVGEKTTATVVIYRLSYRPNIKHAKRIRELLDLDPAGFEHIAALIEQHVKSIWRSTNGTWIFNPDATWEEEKGNLLVLGAYGDRSTLLFSFSRHTSYNDCVWFCGLKRP